MRTMGAILLTSLGGLWAETVPAQGSGFDRAMSAAWPRVVKLYGAEAGLEAGYGTGTIVSGDGLVLTVFSLLIDARRIKAVDADGTAYRATVVHRDAQRQLALLQLIPTGTNADAREGASIGPLPFFEPSRKATLRIGDWVLAVGNAFQVAEGAEPVSLAHGVYAARIRLDARRRLKDFPYQGEVLVIDAITSNPGAPGSALVNLDGEWVGMIGREVISNLTNTHLNYAIPREVLHTFFLEALAARSGAGAGVHEVVSATARNREALKKVFDSGIRLSRVGYRTILPFVEHVRTGSPAQRAGVRKDDLILSVNGRSVTDVAACRARLRAAAGDEVMDLVVRRGQRILSLRIEPDGPSSEMVFPKILP